MDHVPIKHGEISVGDVLRRPVFDKYGRLLLNRGTKIKNARQLAILLAKGLYRFKKYRDTTSHRAKRTSTNPFLLSYDLKYRIDTQLRQLAAGKTKQASRILNIATQLLNLCIEHPDAMLGIVHRYTQAPYSTTHSLHVGILSAILGIQLNYDEKQLHTLTATALTCNIAMLNLQDELQRQQTPLTAEQQSIVNAHPQEGVKLLRKAGINEELWLQAVLQHHERIDGKGYPEARHGDDICTEAKIITIADRYAAMVSERDYRQGKTPIKSLRDFFTGKEAQLDESLCLHFIKAVGTFPPGSCVKLANGETAVVTYRTTVENSTQPIVCSYSNPRGKMYIQPYVRDTSEEQFAIHAMCSTIESLPFNNSVLWGYARLNH